MGGRRTYVIRILIFWGIFSSLLYPSMADKQVASEIQGLELKNVGNRVDNGLPCVPWISYDSDGDGEMMDKNKRRRLHV